MMPSTNYHKFKKLLPDPQEQILNTLGNSAAEAFAQTRRLKKGFAILTNKRVCFKGKCHVRTDSGSIRRLNSYAVDLQDIEACSVVSTRSAILHILAILTAIFAVIVNGWEVYRLLSGVFREQMLFNILIPWLLALVFTLLNQMFSQNLLRVTCKSSSLIFYLQWISSAEAEAFRETLDRARIQHTA